VATQLNDMSLGGSGFAAGYTPIRFAPLVSLTGPITAPAPPAAPEAPMARPPMLPMNQIGGYEGMGPAFTGDAIGEASRMGSPAGRRAEMANLANAAGFLASPAMMAAYALTGQSPAQMFGVGNQREALGLQQSDVMPQGIVPPGGVSRLFGGLRDYLFGPQQQSVPLGPRAPAVDSRAGITSFQDAYNLGLQYGLGEEASNAAGSAAASLVARGVDPITAVTLAMQNASMAATQMDMAGSPFGQPAMQGAAPQGMPGFGQLTPDFLTEYGTPIAPAPAETFGIGGGGQVGSYDFGGSGKAGRSEGFGISDFSGGGQAPY
jgi:hypothetical protein